MKQSSNKKTIIVLIFSLTFLFFVGIFGQMLSEQAQITDFTQKNLPPSIEHLFGTDWMGRDMLFRTISGLSISIRLGVITAAASAFMALGLGTAAAIGGRGADRTVGWLTDLFMGIPHILLLILIAFACERGVMGVVLGITLTHWMQLSRVIRGEVLQLKQSGFVLVAQKLGASRFSVTRTHIVPHVVPQFALGMVLLFPHAILHEAAITFLGFGLPPEQPAIGIILSESMRYIVAGEWWLAVLPGLMLVFTVLLLDRVGASIRKLTGPSASQN